MPKITAAQAAAQKDIPKRTIQHAIAQGDLKAEKLPGVTGTYLIEQRAFDRWIAKRDRKASDRAEASA